jgi:hypothetical protein
MSARDAVKLLQDHKTRSHLYFLVGAVLICGFVSMLLYYIIQ